MFILKSKYRALVISVVASVQHTYYSDMMNSHAKINVYYGMMQSFKFIVPNEYFELISKLKYDEACDMLYSSLLDNLYNLIK